MANEAYQTFSPLCAFCDAFHLCCLKLKKCPYSFAMQNLGDYLLRSQPAIDSGGGIRSSRARKIRLKNDVKLLLLCTKGALR